MAYITIRPSKITAVLFALSMLIQTNIANSQNSFWSNWHVGMSVDLSKNLNTNNFSNFLLGDGTNVGCALFFQRDLNEYWTARFVADVPGFFKNSSGNSFERYGKMMAGIIYGKNWYASVLAGAAVKYDEYGMLAVVAEVGAGHRWFVSESGTFFIEAAADLVSDAKRTLSTSNFILRMGYLHGFGLTKTDKEIEAQKELALIEYSDNMMMLDSIAHYHDMVCLKNEQILIERITKLEEDTVSLVGEILWRDDEIHYLDSLLKDIESNSDNLYSLPFSILFDNDSYIIRNDQKEKIKQIANIIKNDTNAAFIVTGYCDMTGSEEYNQTLSEKRADAVKDMLVDKFGVNEEQLELKGKGKNIAFGDLRSNVNRRVSFFKKVR